MIISNLVVNVKKVNVNAYCSLMRSESTVERRKKYVYRIYVLVDMCFRLAYIVDAHREWRINDQIHGLSYEGTILIRKFNPY